MKPEARIEFYVNGERLTGMAHFFRTKEEAEEWAWRKWRQVCYPTLPLSVRTKKKLRKYLGLD